MELTNKMSNVLFIIHFFAFMFTEVLLVEGHGLMATPRQRGALRVKNRLVGDIEPNAPLDDTAHFPAGNKDDRPGAGHESVVQAAGNFWTPYDPLRDDFRWRAGVCGDELGGEQAHLKGGEFYYPPEDPFRTKTFEQGEVIDIEINVVSHHNGYFEFYICNLDTCSTDDISTQCFHSGHCEKLLRAPSYCDSGDSQDCGPIDPNNPGRWYLPCGLFPKGQSLYGGKEKGSMKYQLPADLVCDHCVVQWYWTAANTCNPPGVVEYFESENAPRWPPCQGQGGAIGGYTAVQAPCHGDKFPEEYWQCSDIRIIPHSSSLVSSSSSQEEATTFVEINESDSGMSDEESSETSIVEGAGSGVDAGGTIVGLLSGNKPHGNVEINGAEMDGSQLDDDNVSEEENTNSDVENSSTELQSEPTITPKPGESSSLDAGNTNGILSVLSGGKKSKKRGANTSVEPSPSPVDETVLDSKDGEDDADESGGPGQKRSSNLELSGDEDVTEGQLNDEDSQNDVSSDLPSMLGGGTSQFALGSGFT